MFVAGPRNGTILTWTVDIGGHAALLVGTYDRSRSSYDSTFDFSRERETEILLRTVVPRSHNNLPNTAELFSTDESFAITKMERLDLRTSEETLRRPISTRSKRPTSIIHRVGIASRRHSTFRRHTGITSWRTVDDRRFHATTITTTRSRSTFSKALSSAFTTIIISSPALTNVSSMPGRCFSRSQSFVQ